MDQEYIEKMIEFFKKAKQADALLHDIFYLGDGVEFNLPLEYKQKLEKYFDEE